MVTAASRCRHVLAALSLLVLLAPLASAHAGGGMGVEARIQMPPWVTWVTGASVVALSFAVVGAFLTRLDHGAAPAAERASTRTVPRPVLRGGRFMGLLLLGVVIANAFVPNNVGSLPQVVVWVLLWSLLPLVAYTLGNPWPVVSPFRALAPLADRLRGARRPLPYPAGLASWPSVVLFVALVGLEVLADEGPGGAAAVGRAALAYAAFTLAGMAAFGSQTWLANGEVFERTFRWWSAFSFVRWGARGPRWQWPGSGLRDRAAVDGSDVAFVIALLYGVNFDGFLATAPGERALAALAANVGSAPAHALLLVAGYLAFLAAFWGCVRWIRSFSESLEPPARLATRFVASLVPIAVAYHLAHNLFYAVETAPGALHAFLDPLGLGWVPAEATAPLALSEGFALAAGGLQMVLIVLGHVVAVLVAHALAFRSFPSRVQAIRSELPLTVVMVFYTLVGLWIVGQGAAPLAGGVA